MPSFTFVSTANAVVLRGAVPVFVDIGPTPSTSMKSLIEAAITPRTKAICVVHYAGVCAEMDAIGEIARRHGLLVIEDAAQALLSTYRGRPAGRLGDFACFSFHETKNVTAGEGGALAINESPNSATAPTWCGRKGQTGALSSPAGSTSTPGSIAGPRSCRANSWQQFCLRSSRTPNSLIPSGERSGSGIMRGLSSLSAGTVRFGPTVPAHCVHNGHSTICLARSGCPRRAHPQARRRRYFDRISLHPPPLFASGPAVRANAWRTER